MSTLRIHPSPAVGAQPRGSRFAAAAYLWLWRMAARVGRRPSAPPIRNVTAEANQVREMALQVKHQDRRFADELLAAADRHERLYG